MPLGQGIADFWTALRERVELSGGGSTWKVTAGSFEAAVAYARDRFGEPVVLDREDHDFWWPRVTVTVTTDASLAAVAPRLEDLARPVVRTEPLPRSLEVLFQRQEVRRAGAPRVVEQRTPDHDRSAGLPRQ